MIGNLNEILDETLSDIYFRFSVEWAEEMETLLSNVQKIYIHHINTTNAVYILLSHMKGNEEETMEKYPTMGCPICCHQPYHL